MSSGPSLGGNGDGKLACFQRMRPEGRIQTKLRHLSLRVHYRRRSFRSSPHLVNRRRRRHHLHPRLHPPPRSDNDVSSPSADDEGHEVRNLSFSHHFLFLFILAFLISGISFPFKPYPNSRPNLRPNSTCSEHATTNSGLFACVHGPLSIVGPLPKNAKLRTIPRVREATRSRGRGSTGRVR